MTIEFHTYHHIAGHLTTRMTIYPWTYGPIGLPGKGKGGGARCCVNMAKGRRKRERKAMEAADRRRAKKERKGPGVSGRGLCIC